jgi:hypothetical protein
MRVFVPVRRDAPLRSRLRADEPPADRGDESPALGGAGARSPAVHGGQRRRLRVRMYRWAGVAPAAVDCEVGAGMMTEFRAASDARATRELGWWPRDASWRQGFAAA